MLCAYFCIAMNVFLLPTDEAFVSDNCKNPDLQQRLFLLTITPTLVIINGCHATFLIKKQWNSVIFTLTLNLSILMHGISR
jgi:hypothetical protein